ncbi:FMN-binding protein [Streptomyces albulus]|nr:FMN-binding protein [Streptomyces noursei]
MRRAVLTAASTSALVVLLLALAPPARRPDRRPGPGRRRAVPGPTGSAPRAAHPPSGTFTGDPVSTRYGTVQVAATVAAGRLTGVRVLHVPSESGRDQEIAAYAVPRLTQEALAAHGAGIDAVSGASYTSAGYIRSLQSALDRAGV